MHFVILPATLGAIRPLRTAQVGRLKKSLVDYGFFEGCGTFGDIVPIDDPKLKQDAINEFPNDVIVELGLTKDFLKQLTFYRVVEGNHRLAAVKALIMEEHPAFPFNTKCSYSVFEDIGNLAAELHYSFRANRVKETFVSISRMHKHINPTSNSFFIYTSGKSEPLRRVLICCRTPEHDRR